MKHTWMDRSPLLLNASEQAVEARASHRLRPSKSDAFLYLRSRNVEDLSLEEQYRLRRHEFDEERLIKELTGDLL
jgi:hypothetical protein